MKTSTAVFLIAVMCYIEVDGASFNFSGGFYPGIIFDRTHRLQHKHQLRNNKHNDDSNRSKRDHGHSSDLLLCPEPIINGTGPGDNENPPIRNYRSHHRHHKHKIL